MKWDMNKTGLVVFIAILAIGIYDLAVVLFSGTSGSVSAFIINTIPLAPGFTFMCGVICGHLFFNMYPEKENKDDKRK